MKNMNFKNFTEVIKFEVAEKLGSGYEVRIDDVRKNNNIILTGLTVIQNGSNISPTIYLNNYYKDYESGKLILPDIINQVIDTYKKNKISQNVDVQYFLNYEEVKERIIYKLINTERNQELLEDVPHVEFFDLSVVFECLILQEQLGCSTILIHNVHQKMWDISTEDLYQTAMENTPRLLKYELKPMMEVLSEILESENPEGFNKNDCMMDFSDSVPMFVLSNRSRVEGASCMLYPNLMRNLSNTIGSSFYIIPSSIHELLLLPIKNDCKGEEIKCMIKEINDTQVSAEEILSYSLYLYNREAGKISLL